MTAITITKLIGKTFRNVVNNDNAELIFEVSDTEKYKFYHEQDCCEHVRIDDIDGDLNDLVGSPLLIAEERSEKPETMPDEYTESLTWTFYTFATAKGYVYVKWYGESNGYYSEDVDFAYINNEGKFVNDWNY